MSGLTFETVRTAMDVSLDDDLVVQNLPLAISFAGRLGKRFPALDDELIESACLFALCKVARVFEPDRGCKISSPLWTACTNEVAAEYARETGLVALPKTTYSQTKRLIEYRDEHGMLPDLATCNQLLGRQIQMKKERYHELLNAVSLLERPLQIDRPAQDGTRTEVVEDCRLELVEPPQLEQSKSEKKALPMRACAVCGKRFKPVSTANKYCDHECSQRAARERARRKEKSCPRRNRPTRDTLMQRMTTT